MEFRLTMYNGVTLLVMGLTGGMALVRYRCAPYLTWPLLYYVLVIGYAEVFEGSLNPYVIFIGLASGLVLRFTLMAGKAMTAARALEFAVFAYVLVRNTRSLLMMPW